MHKTPNSDIVDNVFVEIWKSFRALPVWVQIWAAVLLVPINLTSLIYIAEPMGRWIAFWAIIGMLPNIGITIYERGLSKLMALPHLVPWTVLVALLLFVRPEASGAYAAYLSILLVTDAISLLFDYPDAIKWLRGDRAVAGR